MDAEAVADELDKLLDNWWAITDPDRAAAEYTELMDRFGIDRELFREAFEIAMARAAQRQLRVFLIVDAWNAKPASDKLQ